MLTNICTSDPRIPVAPHFPLSTTFCFTVIYMWLKQQNNADWKSAVVGWGVAYFSMRPPPHNTSLTLSLTQHTLLRCVAANPLHECLHLICRHKLISFFLLFVAFIYLSPSTSSCLLSKYLSPPLTKLCVLNLPRLVSLLSNTGFGQSEQVVRSEDGFF